MIYFYHLIDENLQKYEGNIKLNLNEDGANILIAKEVLKEKIKKKAKKKFGEYYETGRFIYVLVSNDPRVVEEWTSYRYLYK